MRLLTTEQLFWHCGAHTAKPKFGAWTPIPPGICCLLCVWPPRGREGIRFGIRFEGIRFGIRRVASALAPTHIHWAIGPIAVLSRARLVPTDKHIVVCFHMVLITWYACLSVETPSPPPARLL